MNNSKEKLIEIYKFYNQCMIDKNLKDFDNFSNENFILYHMSGNPQSRKDYLNDIKTGNLIYYNIIHDDIKVEFKDENNAILYGKSQLDADPYHSGRKIYKVESICDFKFIDGKWIILQIKTRPY